MRTDAEYLEYDSAAAGEGLTAVEYLTRDTRQTLRAALAELRALEGAENDAAGQLAPELAADLDLHDAIHVIFGCATDVRGEVLAHVWTLLGTTARIRDLQRVVAHGDHRAALAKIGYGNLMRQWIAALPTIATTVWRAARMSRKLRTEDLRSLLDQTLDDIRRTHGIRVTGNNGSGGPNTGAVVRRVGRERVVSGA